MKQFRVSPVISIADTCKEFAEDFKINERDLLIIGEHTYNDYFKALDTKANVVYLRAYGSGEPSDEMVDKMYADVAKLDYNRVIAVGGGSILDVAKLFALKNISPAIDLFERRLPIERDKELILVPTTCGTGSEVTNISILELKSRHTKFGLAVDELYADTAVLIPELLQSLPFKFFATSSIDAFVHAIESYLSPKATPFSEAFSIKAMEMILTGYKAIAKNGPEARLPYLKDFLMASAFAGIAFGNAGTGAVHAMSYPLGGIYHVPHGESNYAMFTGVFKTYQELNPTGKIAGLNKFLSEILECYEVEVYENIEVLFNHLITKKALHEYGVKETELMEFTDSVLEKQQRLMANNYTVLNKDTVYSIYYISHVICK